MEKNRFIVIGGDAAGMSAASRIRKKRPESEVVVYESGDYVSYSACGMPFHIEGIVHEFKDLIHYDVSKFREERHIDVHLRSKVISIDPKLHTISYENNGQISNDHYDKLVITTGASPKIPDALIGAPGVYTLRTLNDLLPFEQSVNKARHVTVVGAGYIGLELAEALRNRGKGVTIIQHSGKLLRGYDSELSSTIENELNENSVQLEMNSEISSVKGGEGDLTITTTSGRIIHTDMIAVAVGVHPNSKIAAEAGIETGISGAIRVNRFMETSQPDIYAAGDVATTFNRITGKETYMPLATGSNKSGRVAGENAAGGHKEYAGITGTEVVKVFSLEVGKTGFDLATASQEGFDPVSVTIVSTSRSSYYPGSQKITIKMVGDRKSGKLLGAEMIGREGVAKRIDIVAAALYSGLSVEDMTGIDYSYSPPFAPTWEPILVAADVLMGKISKA